MLDLERFAYLPPDKRPPLILGAGLLVEKKGFDDLIEACAILLGREHEFACKIVGAGDQEGELKARIARRGLTDRVELLGPRPQGELVRLVREAAVFAAPCVVGRDGNRDGLPTVLLEAMALGTPCVSTDVTGIPEVVRDAETGITVSQREPASLAEAIARLLVDPDLRVRLARRARRLIESEFEVNRNASSLREMFRMAREARVEVVRETG